jgi:hypothetical protein
MAGDGVSKWKKSFGEKPRKGRKQGEYGLFQFETDR